MRSAPSAANATAPVANERPRYVEVVRDLLREMLFAAARDLLAERGWSDIPMADIARAAGVSRQTLYKRFGSREAFAQAFVIHEGERFLDAVESAVRKHAEDPHAAVCAGLEVFLRRAAEDPMVSVLLSDDGTRGTLPLLTTRGLPVLEWASGRLALAIGESWPDSREQDVHLLAESLVRLAISYLTSPSDSPQAMAAAAGRLLAPFVDRALGASARGRADRSRRAR